MMNMESMSTILNTTTITHLESEDSTDQLV